MPPCDEHIVCSCTLRGKYKMRAFGLDKAVTLHARELCREGRAVNAQIVGKLLAFKRDIKFI